jgi:hypothetical protein
MGESKKGRIHVGVWNDNIDDVKWVALDLLKDKLQFKILNT